MLDQDFLSSVNYKQELKRTLKLFGSFATAFSFISITTGIFLNYKFVLEKAGPIGIWSWPVVAIGQMLVALVLAELAGRIPLTGYSYQWITRLSGSALGWLSGWLCFVFSTIVIPSVDFSLAPLAANLLGVEPSPPNLTAIVAIVFSLQIWLNLGGLKIAARINSLAVLTEVVGIVGLTLIFGWLFLNGQSQPTSFLFASSISSTAMPTSLHLSAFLMSFLMGLYTLVGFESAADLAEETINPSKIIPKAILSSVFLSGIFGTMFLILATLSIKDLPDTLASGNPLVAIISSRLGESVALVFQGLVIISIFACGLIITTAASRLIYALARDKVFLFSASFRKVSKAQRVPYNAVLLVWAIGLAVTYFSESLTALVATCSVLPACIYLLTMVSYLCADEKAYPLPRSFSLGRFGKPVAWASVAWLIFSIGVLTIPAEFNAVGYVSLLVIASGLLVYYFTIRPKINRGEAGILLKSVKAP